MNEELKQREIIINYSVEFILQKAFSILFEPQHYLIFSQIDAILDNVNHEISGINKSKQIIRPLNNDEMPKKFKFEENKK
jgi:hypothetical protein